MEAEGASAAFMATSAFLLFQLFLLFFCHALNFGEEAFFFGFAVVRGSTGGSFFERGLREAANDERLDDGDDVGGGPVQSQGAGVGVTEEEEEHGHPLHNLLLHGVAGRGAHFHHGNHGSSHDEGQHVNRQTEDVEDGVLLGEVRHPEDELGSAQLCSCLQYIEEGKEDGDLQQHGQAAAKGGDIVLFVQGHHFHAGALAVIPAALFNLLHHGLQQAHALHAHVALAVERPNEQTNHKGHDDDSNTPVAEPPGKGVNHPVHGEADVVNPAVVHDVVDKEEVFLPHHVIEHQVVFGAGEYSIRECLGALPCGQVDGGHAVGQYQAAFFAAAAGGGDVNGLSINGVSGGAGVFCTDNRCIVLVHEAGPLQGVAIRAVDAGFVATEHGFERTGRFRFKITVLHGDVVGVGGTLIFINRCSAAGVYTPVGKVELVVAGVANVYAEAYYIGVAIYGFFTLLQGNEAELFGNGKGNAVVLYSGRGKGYGVCRLVCNGVYGVIVNGFLVIAQVEHERADAVVFAAFGGGAVDFDVPQLRLRAVYKLAGTQHFNIGDATTNVLNIKLGNLCLAGGIFAGEGVEEFQLYRGGGRCCGRLGGGSGGLAGGLLVLFCRGRGGGCGLRFCGSGGSGFR